MASDPSTRKSYILQVQPVDYSLTAGTNIPAPPESPPRSPAATATNLRLSRPPTSGGGPSPLSSHPIESMPGAFPPATPEKAAHPADTTMSSESNRDTADSFQTATSPTSAKNTHDEGFDTSPRARRPSGVRRLFSLTSLRQSFSSSRTSLSVARPGSSYAASSYATYGHDALSRGGANAPSIMSTTASTTQAPSMHSTKPNTLRKKRSSNWFKRKSGFFTMNEDGVLDVVSEDDGRTGAKRFKDSSHPPLPMLPELSALGGGELNEGSLGWDERAFKS